MNFSELTKDSILSDEVYEEIIDTVDPVSRADIVNNLLDRAKQLGRKEEVRRKLSAYQKAERDALAKEKRAVAAKEAPKLDNYTHFDYPEMLAEMRSGRWIADETGVRTFNILGEVLACYHPILIEKRYINAETGKEKVKIAYNKGGVWRSITVDKAVIASASKIVTLADYGISVTSETAKNLVKFLADLENENLELIDMKTSTSKFGWVRNFTEFMPYGTNIEFDDAAGFADLVESVSECGSREKWYDLALKLRSWRKKEIAIYMAASFGSVLLKPLQVLPFIVNLWAETGKGKTVNLMVATSIWANPGEHRYITDPCGTPTSIEVRNNILNHLPTMIDDLSKMRDRYGYDAVTDFVYIQCGGKGRDRANKELKLREKNTWHNITLTNIERPLSTEHMNGGAVNRILDFEMDNTELFKEIKGNAVCKIINKNYGFAGQDFIKAVQSIGFEEIARIQNDFYQEIERIANGSKEEKQMLPLSVLLTADKIATDYLFKDGIYLNIEELVTYLKNRDDVSEYTRAYEYILSELAVNRNKFIHGKDDYVSGELWGMISENYAFIYKSKFDQICSSGNVSSKGFLSWAKAHDLIQADDKRDTKLKRIGENSPQRCVCLKISDETDDDFMELDDADMKELPFS